MNQNSSEQNNSSKIFWENSYKDKAISTFGGPSIEVYEMLPLIIPEQKVVDLGCGEGRNALFLAQHGCKATAVDISSSGIEKVKLAASTLGVEINTMVCDLNDYKADDSYDIVLAHTSVHFLTNSKWRELLGELKERTNPGGLHSLTIFLDTPKYPLPSEILAIGHKQSFAAGELKEFYGDWEIIRYDAYLKQDKHPGIPMHSHYVEKILCRKNTDISKRGKDYTYKSLYSGEHDLSMEIFDKVQIGDDEQTVRRICGEPKLINEVDFGKAVGAREIVETKYILRDLFYGKTAFQLANGEVKGKYIYDTEPIRVLPIEK